MIDFLLFCEIAIAVLALACSVMMCLFFSTSGWYTKEHTNKSFKNKNRKKN